MIGIEIMCDVSGRKIEKLSRTMDKRDSYVGFHLQIVSQLFWGLFAGRHVSPSPRPARAGQSPTKRPCHHRAVIGNVERFEKLLLRNCKLTLTQSGVAGHCLSSLDQ
jgi:hypothetical protein